MDVFISEEEVILYLTNFIKEKGRFPVVGTDFDTGKIYKYIKKFGGIRYFRKILNQPLPFRSKNYWNDIEIVKFEIEEAFPELIRRNIFPTTEMLKSKIKGIKDALRKHGGVIGVSKAMNCKTNHFVSTDGHYLDSACEFLFDEFLYLNNIPHEVHGLISENLKYRYDFKIEDFYVEIWGYDKKLKSKRSLIYNKKREIKENLYNILNKKLISIESFIFDNGYWKIEDYFKQIISKIYHDFKFKNNIFDIIESPYYWNDGKIIEELEIIIKNIGQFPSRKYLLSNDRGDLVHAIKYFGGFPKFRMILEVKNRLNNSN